MQSWIARLVFRLHFPPHSRIVDRSRMLKRFRNDQDYSGQARPPPPQTTPVVTERIHTWGHTSERDRFASESDGAFSRNSNIDTYIHHVSLSLSLSLSLLTRSKRGLVTEQRDATPGNPVNFIFGCLDVWPIRREFGIRSSSKEPFPTRKRISAHRRNAR